MCELARARSLCNQLLDHGFLNLDVDVNSLVRGLVTLEFAVSCSNRGERTLVASDVQASRQIADVPVRREEQKGGSRSAGIGTIDQS